MSRPPADYRRKSRKNQAVHAYRKDTTLRKALSKVGILGKLKTMRLKMGSKFSDITMSEIEAFIEEPEQFGKALIASELTVY